MGVQKSDIKAIGYMITLTLIIYIPSLLIFNLTPISLMMRLAFVILVFVMMYVVTRIFYENPFKIESQSSYFDSLIHVLALISIISILAIIVTIALFGGVNIDIREIYINAKPAFVDAWNAYLPVYALIYWGINGTIVAYFYHSVTFELFKRRGKIMGILAAVVLFTLNYNAPLISNYWNWWDITGFGLIFACSYSVKRNPLVLLSAYILFEVPLWWCILAPLGENVFAFYFIGRIVISIIALVIFVNKGLKTRIKAYQRRKTI